MSKQKSLIHLSKIIHRGENRIKVSFGKESTLLVKIKSIDGRKWSQTKKCWHLPYDKISYQNLITVFGRGNLVIPTSDKNPTLADITTPQIIEYKYKGVVKRKFVGDLILVNLINDKWLQAFVPNDKKHWIDAIKNINGRQWNSEEASWKLPNVKTTYRILKRYIGLKCIQFNFEIKKDIPEFYKTEIRKKYQPSSKVNFQKLNLIQKQAIYQLREKLILKKLSPSTIKTYQSILIQIFLFFSKKDPIKIESEDIEKYLLYLVQNKRISESTQNQIVNAYKAYAEKVLNKPKEFLKIIRPKKSKKLPNVLSQKEVLKIINALQNIKHQLILMMIYSSGLRLSEVVNLKINDIHIHRKNIFIRGGKGKKTDMLY